jgi:hypothetical protein
MRAVAIALLMAAATARAQSDATSIAKASQNPVGSMISVPFQANWNFNAGSSDRTQFVGNLQPVLPMDATRDYRLVPRLIIPFMQQPIGLDETDVGIGDVQLEIFLATKSPNGHGVVWGVGPVFTLATASRQSLGSERWSAGPAIVTIFMPGNWVAGFLLTQQWSYAGTDNSADRPPVAPFLLQPVVNYNLRDGWAISTSPIITAQWLSGDDSWLVPVGGGVSKVFAISRQHMSTGLQAYAHPIRPELAPSWNLRATVTLLFPTAP